MMASNTIVEDSMMFFKNPQIGVGDKLSMALRKGKSIFMHVKCEFIKEPKKLSKYWSIE